MKARRVPNMSGRGALALAFALGLAGCAVGPDYQSALDEAPGQAAFVNGTAAEFSAAQVLQTDWWRLYQDPALDALVNEALAANRDLRVAAANLERAEALWRESRTPLLPSTTVNASETYSRQNYFFGDAPLSTQNNIYNANLSIAYQVDLFGRVRRAIEAARADAQAVRAAYESTRITVVGAVVRSYAAACHANRQLTVAEQNLQLQSDRLALTRNLLDAGRGTAMEVATGAAQQAQTRALIPQLRANRQAVLYQLAALLGHTPDQVPPAAMACESAPTLQALIPVGDGAQLLRRRPDVLQAERNLAAATARIGVATAELYPNVSFAAGIGSAAQASGDLFSSDTEIWNYGPSLSWVFPNITGVRARIRQAEASTEAALARFDAAWLDALRETETAMTSYLEALQRRAALAEVSQHSDDAARLAQLRFNAGQLNYLDVLQAELNAVNARIGLVAGDAEISALQVDLFLALGGGWSADQE
ncbi:MAG TPA: efflux transporter outer membrane subunit [Hyphomicrobiales bacterium]|nr:efflux transporter outer membrane subunit [Hyphomicrobiales bacterium]